MAQEHSEHELTNNCANKFEQLRQESGSYRTFSLAVTHPSRQPIIDFADLDI